LSFRGGKLKSHGLIQKRSLTKKADADAKKRKVKSQNRLKRSEPHEMQKFRECELRILLPEC